MPLDIASLIRLFALAAIWGAAFLFMRISVPVLGPALLVECRVGLAALFLLAIAFSRKKGLSAGANWQHYLVLGLFNSALPFLLFGYAAKTLPASVLSILNATAPIWGAVIAALWTRTPLSRRTMLGLVLGVTGVAVLVGFDSATLQPEATLAVLGALAAAFSYGLATTYAKSAKEVDAFANAHGSMWAATLLIAPAVPFFPAISFPGPGVIAAVVALGVVCTGVAYLLYFRLIADLGAASALTVTFLIPLFGVLFGRVFLGEEIGWHTAVGSLIVVAGTALVTGFSPGSLRRSKAA